jgi:hypothetical protein
MSNRQTRWKSAQPETSTAVQGSRFRLTGNGDIPNSHRTTSGGRRPALVADKREKIRAINDAVHSDNLEDLRRLSCSAGGLLEHGIRRRAWTRLLLLTNPVPSDSPRPSGNCRGWVLDLVPTHRVKMVLDLDCAMEHRDTRQVALDVNRAFSMYPAGKLALRGGCTSRGHRSDFVFLKFKASLQQSEFGKKRSCPMWSTLFSAETQSCTTIRFKSARTNRYFLFAANLACIKGFHDVCSVLLLVLGERGAVRAAERMALFFLRYPFFRGVLDR